MASSTDRIRELVRATSDESTDDAVFRFVQDKNFKLADQRDKRHELEDELVMALAESKLRKEENDKLRKELEEDKQFLRYLLACSTHDRPFNLKAHVSRIERILGEKWDWDAIEKEKSR